MAPDNIRDKVEKLIKDLTVTIQTRCIYDKAHRLTREAIDKFHLELNDVLSGRDEFVIGVIGNEIAFEKEPFYEMSKKITGFISYLKEIKVEKISFLKNLERNEVTDFIDIFAMDAKSIDGSGGIKKISEAAGLRNIIFGKIGVKKEKEETEEDIAVSKKNFQEGIEFLRKTLDDINNGRPIDTKAALFVIDKIITNLLKNRYLLLILTAIKSHDEYTFVHSVNSAIFSIVQAEALGLKEGYLRDIGVAGLLHDVGKLAIPGDLIRKKEQLDKNDIEKIHLHPVEGAKVLIQRKDINPLAAIAAFEHHIRYDMKGYPRKLYGDSINLVSMIITISDIYDALRTKRSYHQAMTLEDTYEEMIKLSGEEFHPDLLNNFFRIIGVYPPGTLVELDNKMIGFVVKENTSDIKTPQIEILYNSKGEKEENPYIINLMEKEPSTQNYTRTIVRSISPSDKYKIPDKYIF